MTAQVSDAIFFEGRWMALACEPLAPWLDRRKNRKLRFQRQHSACWRGYSSQWEVTRGRLYLTRFSARLQNGRFAGLPTLFQNYSDAFYAQSGAKDLANQGPGRFAFWVTGTLSCRIGRVRHYRHMGYESTCDAVLQLVFQRGLLIGQRIIRHDDVDALQRQIEQ